MFAIQDCEFLQFVGGVDPDARRRDRFERSAGCAAWPSLAEVPVDSVDTVIIATPTSTHLPIVSDALSRFSPSWVICEKPLGENASEAREIRSRCEKHGASLAVNYFRLYLPWVVNLQQAFQLGVLGRFLGGSVVYSHGLRRNGCHFLNLVVWLVGRERAVSISGAGKPHSDPTFQLRIGDAFVGFQSLDLSTVRVGDVTLAFEGGILRIVDGGHESRWGAASQGASAEHPRYPTPMWANHDDMLHYQSPLYRRLRDREYIEFEHAWSLDAAIITQQIIDEVTHG